MKKKRLMHTGGHQTGDKALEDTTDLGCLVTGERSGRERRCLRGQGALSPLPRACSTLGFGAEPFWGCLCWRGWEGSRVMTNCSTQNFQRCCWVSLKVKPGCCLNRFVPARRGEEPCPQPNTSEHWVMRISPSKRHLEMSSAE